MSKKIFFSVGEPSGDQHAARLIESLRKRAPDLQTRGFGGSQMTSAGCRLDLDLTRHAVVGLVEVLPKLRDFFRFADQAEQIFRGGSVDAVVLVDFPGFNWHIARRAKKYQIPVYYYCPPQLWAWGGWRVRKMRRYVDHVLAVLPIEEAFFSDRGIPTTYVGHPFFDGLADSSLNPSVLQRLDQYVAEGEQLVAVLPGSRDHEVRRNWPLMLASIQRLHQQHPRSRFLVACYRDSQCLWCRDQLHGREEGLPIEFFVDCTSEVIDRARCAMMVSGSVSLELMARRTPAAVVYRVGRLLHSFAKLVVRVDSITLPNLMAGRKIFPEYVSVGDPSGAVEFLTESVDALLGDSYYYRDTLRQLDQLRSEQAVPGASGRAADWIIDQVFADTVSAATSDAVSAVTSDAGARRAA